ncbi:hypothetical protein [Kribbella italica]|uniref:Uncharacterized protein n=1 Tax=Kribbella italica TaxID=1540520 RepID=A0A7W9J6P0_9ACTN|nr:hypothetical protein [Kribbella italica]MBB5836483.1 hypothetical protein [Kribbella italica]
MGGGDPIVSPESAVHREFARLYAVARRIARPSVDRWSGVLRAAYTPPGEQQRWGAFDPASGDISLSAELVLPYLTGPGSRVAGPAQGQALATVLHEATHAGMETDAPDEPNAVRTAESLALIEAFAEYRAVQQFETFAAAAGYPEAYLTTPQYPGWYTAMDDLVRQVSGPVKDRAAFLNEAIQGPGALHFDQLADSVVKNRLTHDVPTTENDQRAARAALIPAMTHRLWPSLRSRPAESGLMVANEIRQHLDAEVDKIRHHYRSTSRTPYPADPPNPAAIQLRPADARTTQPEQAPSPSGVAMRFLDAQAPASRATSFRPTLAQGARGAGSPTTPKAQRPTERRWD